MTKVILVFAQCTNQTALGDYSLASSIAYDLSQAIKDNQENIDVILTAMDFKINKYERLYGKLEDGRLNIRGQSIGLCALEQFDAVLHETVALIVANPCETPHYNLLLSVMSPKSKLIIINSLSRKVILNNDAEKLHALATLIPQYFSMSDMLINSCGFTHDSLGIPSIAPLNELTITTEEQQKIPSGTYGFMYLARSADQEEALRCGNIIIDYMRLTQFDTYVLVGAFHQKDFQNMPLKKAPHIIFYPSLPHHLMCQMLYRSSGKMVLTTGVMSTLEAFHYGKLVFYQDDDVNTLFIEHYLASIKQACSEDALLSASLSRSIQELAALLFTQKPLESRCFNRLHTILNLLPAASDKLIEINQNLLAKQHSRFRVTLFNFIYQPHQTSSKAQVDLAVHTLCTHTNNHYIKALIASCGAAASGLLFELKILLAYFPTSQDAQSGPLHFSALHWAIHNHTTDSPTLTCIKFLIATGANVNIEDTRGRTPLSLAVEKNIEAVIKWLLAAKACIVIQEREETKELVGFIKETRVKYGRQSPTLFGKSVATTPPALSIKVSCDHQSPQKRA